jgi:hypothetical protein
MFRNKLNTTDFKIGLKKINVRLKRNKTALISSKSTILSVVFHEHNRSRVVIKRNPKKRKSILRNLLID